MSLIERCTAAAASIRSDLIKMTYNTGTTGAHIGGSLSIVEIMSVLYLAIMNYNPTKPNNESRDRFILSKGHGAMAQYAAMKQAGLISDEELQTFKQNNTFLYAHPSMNIEKGIEFSSGSLGQGLSLAVGTALALKMKKNYTSRVYVLLGDGECNEGSVWEAAMSAAHYKLDNLTVIIDKNKLQYDGETKYVLGLAPFEEKWKSFGFETVTIDGHNVESLINAFAKEHKNKPMCIIANTIKGKGVSFMENEAKWHNGSLTKELFEQALAEQGAAL